MENMWQDNAFTIVAELVHEKVHSGDVLTRSKSKIRLSDVSVFSQSLGIYGKADCIELRPSYKGVAIHGFPGKYLLDVIEYKPTAFKDKPANAERLQLYAQTRCIEEIFSIKPSAYFYFSDTNKREKIEFDNADKELLHEIIEKIEKASQNISIPPIVYSSRCKGCSMLNICLPNCKNVCVSKMIIGGMK